MTNTIFTFYTQGNKILTGKNVSFQFIMPTIYEKVSAEKLKRKPREKQSLEVLKAAYNEVIEQQENGLSIRAIAEKYNIPKTSLTRYVKNKKIPENKGFASVFVSRQIFTLEEESMLCSYLLKACNMHYGLSLKQTKELAYQYAVANNKNIPNSWKNNNCASKDWLVGFLNRNKKLSLRKPEATSLSRSTSFNKKNVGDFFGKLRDLYERYQFPPSSVYNVDETGVTTVQVPGKILAEKGKKQIGKITSGERGVLVTLCCAINAIGNSLPPFFVFPRKRFKDLMLVNAPAGSAGGASTSGWMNSEIFLEYMKHFAKYAKPSVESPILLIYDNHESHISIDVINFAKENGIVLLTLPPHCSNKLQPLDVAVYSAFKRYYNAAVDSWLVNHPGIPVSIYQVAQLVAEAFSPAFSKSNIESGFAKTGIFPFRPSIFDDSDFLCSAVTDREHQTADTIVEGSPVTKPTRTATPVPSTSTSETANTFVSPECIRPYPKALPRKRKQGGRKPGRTRILTDTPEKKEIEEALKVKEDKIKKAQVKRNLSGYEKRPVKKQKIVVPESTSESEENVSDVCEESDDSPFSEEEIEDDQNDRNFNKNDFVIVKFSTETTNATINYIGLIIKKAFRNYTVKFLRRHGVSNKFCFPLIDDIQDVVEDDIVRKIKPPVPFSGTKRAGNGYSFNIACLNVQNIR